MDGKLLKKKILELNVTQADLSRLLNVTPQSLTAIFSAKDVRSGTIERMSQVLKVSPTYFYSKEKDSPINSSVQTISSGSNNTQIIHGEDSDVSLLRQRVVDLEQIIFEKERLISILLKK